jgi:hypothetical protein
MNNKQNNTNKKFGRVLAVPSLLPCFTLAFALQLRKCTENPQSGKNSVLWAVIDKVCNTVTSTSSAHVRYIYQVSP